MFTLDLVKASYMHSHKLYIVLKRITHLRVNLTMWLRLEETFSFLKSLCHIWRTSLQDYISSLYINHIKIVKQGNVYNLIRPSMGRGDWLDNIPLYNLVMGMSLPHDIVVHYTEMLRLMCYLSVVVVYNLRLRVITISADSA